MTDWNTCYSPPASNKEKKQKILRALLFVILEFVWPIIKANTSE